MWAGKSLQDVTLIFGVTPYIRCYANSKISYANSNIIHIRRKPAIAKIHNDFFKFRREFRAEIISFTKLSLCTACFCTTVVYTESYPTGIPAGMDESLYGNKSKLKLIAMSYF